jgi:hypothetical protein
MVTEKVSKSSTTQVVFGVTRPSGSHISITVKTSSTNAFFSSNSSRSNRHEPFGPDLLPQQQAQVFRGHLADRHRPKPVYLLHEARDGDLRFRPLVAFQLIKRSGQVGSVIG